MSLPTPALQSARSGCMIEVPACKHSNSLTSDTSKSPMRLLYLASLFSTSLDGKHGIHTVLRNDYSNYLKKNRIHRSTSALPMTNMFGGREMEEKRARTVTNYLQLAHLRVTSSHFRLPRCDSLCDVIICGRDDLTTPLSLPPSPRPTNAIGQFLPQ